MKKSILILSFMVLLLVVVVGGLSLYAVNTPEYALKKIIEDVNDFGVEGLNPHLTDKAKETLDAVSSITDSGVFNAIIGFIDQKNYIGVLKSELQKTRWGVDDILKSKENAAVVLSFNYEDKLIGTIEISMIREEGEWKVDGLGLPKFEKINW